MIKMILASHGDLSKGMRDSVAMIVGELADRIEYYSLYPGENPNDYVESIKESIESFTDSYVFVTDIKGGSVYNALITLCVYPNVTVVSGMNMNLVLDLVLSYDQGRTNPNFELAIDSGKKGIGMVNQATIDIDIEEEEF